MDEQYKALYKQAADMQYKMHDYTVQSAHDPQSMVLRHEMHQLTNELATGRNPLTIEARLKTIENQLRYNDIAHPQTGTGAPGPLMHPDHQQYMLKSLDSMRMNLKHPPGSL